jgi:hypothetical protein
VCLVRQEHYQAGNGYQHSADDHRKEDGVHAAVYSRTIATAEQYRSLWRISCGGVRCLSLTHLPIKSQSAWACKGRYPTVRRTLQSCGRRLLRVSCSIGAGHPRLRDKRAQPVLWRASASRLAAGKMNILAKPSAERTSFKRGPTYSTALQSAASVTFSSRAHICRCAGSKMSTLRVWKMSGVIDGQLKTPSHSSFPPRTSALSLVWCQRLAEHRKCRP